MVSSHLLIGLGEGYNSINSFFIIRVRSDLIYIKTNNDKKNSKSSFYGLFIFLLLCLTLITPYASSSPDGLEPVAGISDSLKIAE